MPGPGQPGRTAHCSSAGVRPRRAGADGSRRLLPDGNRREVGERWAVPSRVTSIRRLRRPQQVQRRAGRPGRGAQSAAWLERGENARPRHASWSARAHAERGPLPASCTPAATTSSIGTCAQAAGASRTAAAGTRHRHRVHGHRVKRTHMISTRIGWLEQTGTLERSAAVGIRRRLARPVQSGWSARPGSRDADVPALAHTCAPLATARTPR